MTRNRTTRPPMRSWRRPCGMPTASCGRPAAHRPSGWNGSGDPWEPADPGARPGRCARCELSGGRPFGRPPLSLTPWSGCPGRRCQSTPPGFWGSSSWRTSKWRWGACGHAGLPHRADLPPGPDGVALFHGEVPGTGRREGGEAVPVVDDHIIAPLRVEARLGDSAVRRRQITSPSGAGMSMPAWKVSPCPPGLTRLPLGLERLMVLDPCTGHRKKRLLSSSTA